MVGGVSLSTYPTTVFNGKHLSWRTNVRYFLFMLITPWGHFNHKGCSCRHYREGMEYTDLNSTHQIPKTRILHHFKQKTRVRLLKHEQKRFWKVTRWQNSVELREVCLTATDRVTASCTPSSLLRPTGGSTPSSFKKVYGRHQWPSTHTLNSVE